MTPPILCGVPMISRLHPAAFRTRNILASNTETICVSPAATATSPIPNEFAQNIVDESSVSFRLSGDGGGADARTFPYGSALNVVSVKQLWKDIAQHVRTDSRQQSQGA